MKRTNTKSYIEPLHRYLLGSINSEDRKLKTDKEKINYFFECFEGEFNHEYNKRRYNIYQVRVSEYLMGLPSCISVVFTYYDIGRLAEKLHDCELTENQKEGICSNYWNHLAHHLLKLREKLNK